MATVLNVLNSNIDDPVMIMSTISDILETLSDTMGAYEDIDSTSKAGFLAILDVCSSTLQESAEKALRAVAG